MRPDASDGNCVSYFGREDAFQLPGLTLHASLDSIILMMMPAPISPEAQHEAQHEGKWSRQKVDPSSNSSQRIREQFFARFPFFVAFEMPVC